MTGIFRLKIALGVLLTSLSPFVLDGSQNQKLIAQADFKSFDERAHSGEKLNVVFFGGSLTWGAQATDPQMTSYRAQMAHKFGQKYPQAHFCFWDSGIGGTGSQLGAFRLERDVLLRKPDLVFLDFTVNDDPFGPPNPNKLASYESLVRRLVLAGVPVVQVVFAVKKDVMRNPPPRLLDEKHKEIAHAYNVPIGDAVALMRKRVAEGDATSDELWSVPADQTHPGDAGYALYAEAAWSAFQEAVGLGIKERVPKNMLNAETYMTVNRQHFSSFTELPEGWQRGQPSRSAIAYDFIPSRWLDDIIIATVLDKQPKPLCLKIRGENVLLYGEATPQSGKYQVRIDAGEFKSYDVGASAKTGNLRYVQIIAEGLDPNREHRFEIMPQIKACQELRVESICVAGIPATVSLERNP